MRQIAIHAPLTKLKTATTSQTAAAAPAATTCSSAQCLESQRLARFRLERDLRRHEAHHRDLAQHDRREHADDVHVDELLQVRLRGDHHDGRRDRDDEHAAAVHEAVVAHRELARQVAVGGEQRRQPAKRRNTEDAAAYRIATHATAMSHVGQRVSKHRVGHLQHRRAVRASRRSRSATRASSRAKNAAARRATAMSSVRPARTPCGASWNGPDAASASMPVIITEPEAMAPANAMTTGHIDACAPGVAGGISGPSSDCRDEQRSRPRQGTRTQHANEHAEPRA